MWNHLFAFSLLLLSSTAKAQVDDWRQVDALAPGTKIVVTLTSGEERIGEFARTTADELTMRGETLQKSVIATVATYDPLKDGVMRGALAGAAAFVVLMQTTANNCGIGCEYDAPSAIIIPVGAFGAGVGSLIGLLADLDAGRSVVLYPPTETTRPTRTNPRPSVRMGPFFSHTFIQSPLLEGNAAAAGFSFAVQVSPHITAHVEYTATNGVFRAKPGSIPDTVLQNLVPATSRSAGFSKGVESRRISFAFSELIGIHPRPWGRLRLEFLAGLGVQGREERDYYDAYQGSGDGTMNNPFRSDPLPGKYYSLNFETPKGGLVLGLDAEIALFRGLAVVPMVRYSRMGDPGPSITYGVGAQWRF